MAFTDKVYVKNHRTVAAQLETRFPRGAFRGATLDLLFTGDLGKLDDATREQVVAFAEDFLDCGCASNPYCGHPERKFIRYVLELRASGLGPEAVVDAMTGDYMVYAFPGDVVSFLDNAVRGLDAAEAIASVAGNEEMVGRIREARGALV